MELPELFKWLSLSTSFVSIGTSDGIFFNESTGFSAIVTVISSVGEGRVNIVGSRDLFHHRRHEDWIGFNDWSKPDGSSSAVPKPSKQSVLENNSSPEGVVTK